jgi:hypothetical protein
MSSKDGLHSRFHAKHEPINSDAHHRGAVLIEAHVIAPYSSGSPEPGNLEQPLLSPLLSSDTFARPSGSPRSPYIVRREPSRWDSARFTAVSFACTVLDLLPTSVSLKIADEPTRSEQLLISNLRDTAVHPFDKSNLDHQALVAELWDMCHRGQQLFAPGLTGPPDLPADLKSERWKDFGFQGVDPSTDFRGAGVFSLRNLLYLSSSYPQLFGKLVRAEYPFAVAGINVTMLLMTQLGLTAVGQTCLATVQNTSANAFSFCLARTKFVKIIASGGAGGVRDAEIVFCEVYCVALALLHDRWLQSNRNLMEFNSHLKWLARQIETILKCSQDLGAVLAHAMLE